MKRRAFTLLEALVCVAIVALLASIALPVLKQVQGASRQMACTSNLRQLMTAATAYGASNSAAMPPAVLYFQDGGSVRSVCWDFTVAADGTASPGSLWQYMDTPFEVQQCPDFMGASNAPGDPYTGYNYNTTYIGHEGGFPTVDSNGRTRDGWATTRLGKPVAWFSMPDRTAVFGDGGWKSGANKFMRAPMNTVEGSLPLVCAGTQAFRHSGACTCCACLDGHVEVRTAPERGQLTTDALARLVIGHPANGFLSADDSAYSGSQGPQASAGP